MTPEELRTQLERDMPMDGVPQKAKDLVWAQAWERGWPYGVDEVSMAYDDGRAIALLAAGLRAE